MSAQTLCVNDMCRSISSLSHAAKFNSNLTERKRLLGKRLSKIIDESCEFIFVVIQKSGVQYELEKDDLKFAAVELSSTKGIKIFCFLLEQLKTVLSANSKVINATLAKMEDLQAENEKLMVQVDQLSKETEVQTEVISELKSKITELQDHLIKLINNQSVDISNDSMKAVDSLAKQFAEMEKPFKNIRRLISALAANDCHILEMYPALNGGSGDACLLVIYTGPVIIPATSIDGTSVVFKHQSNPDYCHDIKDWRRYRVVNAELCASFCEKFSRSSACIQLISDRSDVVAVFPSVHWHSDATFETLPFKESFDPSENTFQMVIKVVVKAAGFVPLGEPSIPAEMYLEGELLKVVVVEGYSKTCVKRGDAISGSQVDRGFGTIAGLVKKEEPSGGHEYYAVTCKHVIDASRIQPSFLPAATPSVLASPPPVYRRFKMLQSLNRQVFDVDGSIRALESHSNYAMRESHAQEVKRHMRSICNNDLTLLSVGDHITLEDIKIFTTHGAELLGNTDLAQYPAETPITVTYNNSTIQITGDIALVPISNTFIDGTNTNTSQTVTIEQLGKIWSSTPELNVFKLGASSGLTQGIILRPGHVRAGQTSPISNFFADRKNNDGAVLYLNQILIFGENFGYGGDSGSLVYANESNTATLVGIFTGKLDSQLFWVSPIECLGPQYVWQWQC